MNQFWKDAIERALKTGAQVILAAAAGNQLVLFSIDILEILQLAAASIILSVLMSYVSSGVNNNNSASLIKYGDKS